MTNPLCTLDLARMRKDRMSKMRDAMTESGIDAHILCLQSNVSYATGARLPTADHVRAAGWRPVRGVQRADPWRHLLPELPQGSPPEVPGPRRHPAVELEVAAGRGDL